MAFSGPVGLDMPAALDVLTAYGVDRAAAAMLLPYAEAGLLRALARHKPSPEGT